MMKVNRKLVLRRENPRALANRDLMYVAAGDDSGTIQLRDSGDAGCRTDAPAKVQP